MLGFSSRAFIALFILLCVSSAHGHNKVVVVPLGGDEAQDLEPTSPVAKVNPSQTDYTILTNTVIDKITKLEWQREDDNTTRNWDDALDYCAGLTLDGKSDWRLPDVVELQSIVDYGQATAPTIDGVAFTGTNSSSYWSASSGASSSGSAWFVGFDLGIVFAFVKTNDIFVRCVR
ncbi:MAG: DUF1566 domain-containing protein [Gammaproteobacteria bacterium]|nr:DUF1566 domain-containing protein [Gammaproteobacteria bacterium]